MSRKPKAAAPPPPDPVRDWLPFTIEDAELAAALTEGPPLEVLDAVNLRVRALSREDTRRSIASIPKAFDVADPKTLHPFSGEFYSWFLRVFKGSRGAFLKEVERMSFQGLKGSQIAARLGVDIALLAAAAREHKDIELALSGGAARAADELSATVMDASLNGDPKNAWRMLELRHDYVEVVDPTPAPTININLAPGTETFERAAILNAGQAEVLALMDESEKGVSDSDPLESEPAEAMAEAEAER